MDVWQGCSSCEKYGRHCANKHKSLFTEHTLQWCYMYVSYWTLPTNGLVLSVVVSGCQKAVDGLIREYGYWKGGQVMQARDRNDGLSGTVLMILTWSNCRRFENGGLEQFWKPLVFWLTISWRFCWIVSFERDSFVWICSSGNYWMLHFITFCEV